MKSRVNAYKIRRAKRIRARMDAAEDKGRWITTENGHKVHLNEEGNPDKGNPHVLEKMAGGASAQINKLNERAQSLNSMKKADRLKEFESMLKDMPTGSRMLIKDPTTSSGIERRVTKTGDGSFVVDTYEDGKITNQGAKWSIAALKHWDNKKVSYQFGDIETPKSESPKPAKPKPATVEPVSAPEAKKEMPKTQNTPDAAGIQKAKEEKAKEAAKTEALLKKIKAEQAKKDAISKIDKEIEDLEHEMYKAQHYGNNESGNWDYSDECEAKIHELEAKKKKLLGK